jgi:hypothetical protein
MAQGNDWLLLTTGLAQVEGEYATYIRASDNLLVGPAGLGVPAPGGSRLDDQ